MLAKRTKLFGMYTLAVLITTSISAFAIAQEDDEQDADEEEVIEEIVVYGGERPDDPVDVDALYEDMLQDMLMTDMQDLEALREDQDWRNSDDATTVTSGRIKWGYSPQDDLRFDRQSDMPDAHFITTKPATQFSFEF